MIDTQNQNDDNRAIQTASNMQTTQQQHETLSSPSAHISPQGLVTTNNFTVVPDTITAIAVTANYNLRKANYLDRSDIKPTKKRYLILLLFCLHSAINSLQWIYLSSITNTVSKFYQVNNMAINWTSMVYMLVYIPFVIPSTWLFERIGMRNSIIIGSLGTSLGSLIKCFSCQPDRFSLLMSGQTLVAISQLFVLSVPPRLASIWFPDDQVSLATACGVFGNQFGIALGFVVPHLFLGEHIDSTNQSLDMQQLYIGSSLFNMFLTITTISTLITLLIIILFDHTPNKPPGLARLHQIKQEQNAIAEAAASLGVHPLVNSNVDGSNNNNNGPNSHSFSSLLCDLMTDVNFVLLMISYGLNVGVFYAISTVLNQMILLIWPDDIHQANLLVGRLGLVMVILGMFGSVISGFILDKTRKYRLVNASLYLLSFVSMILFSITLQAKNVVALYLAVAALGYFMTGYLFIGYEMSNEITWPRPESVTAGLLNLSAQVFGVILTYSGSYIVDTYRNVAANLYFIAAIALGLLVTLLIKTQLKRQSAIDT